MAIGRSSGITGNLCGTQEAERGKGEWGKSYKPSESSLPTLLYLQKVLYPLQRNASVPSTKCHQLGTKYNNGSLRGRFLPRPKPFSSPCILLVCLVVVGCVPDFAHITCWVPPFSFLYNLEFSVKCDCWGTVQAINLIISCFRALLGGTN